jgi:hypothetical protein
LTERDDTIKRLEEELDAYDTRQMELEDEMDKKTSALISLQVSFFFKCSSIELHYVSFESILASFDTGFF